MDKDLARKLHPLIAPDVQEALNLLLEHRKELAVRNMTNAQEDRHMYNSQGAVKELDFLLNARQYIITKAE